MQLHPSDQAPLPLGASGLAFAYHPSPAFGDGSHPTTRMMIGAVDFLCRNGRVTSFLDVGTGTGILARLARARGASFVVGTDIDPIALDSAARNSTFDRHPHELILSGELPDHWGARFDLVAANILEAPLRELAPSLARALAPQGTLLLSGFTPLQTPMLRIAFENQDLRFESESALEGWSLLGFRR